MQSTDNMLGGWRKSSYSGYNTNCVEVGVLDSAIGVRDTKSPKSVILNFSATQWDAFLGGVRNGEFDRKPGAR